MGLYDYVFGEEPQPAEEAPEVIPLPESGSDEEESPVEEVEEVEDKQKILREVIHDLITERKELLSEVSTFYRLSFSLLAINYASCVAFEDDSCIVIFIFSLMGMIKFGSFDILCDAVHYSDRYMSIIDKLRVHLTDR